MTSAALLPEWLVEAKKVEEIEVHVVEFDDDEDEDENEDEEEDEDNKDDEEVDMEVPKRDVMALDVRIPEELVRIQDVFELFRDAGFARSHNGV